MKYTPKHTASNHPVCGNVFFFFSLVCFLCHTSVALSSLTMPNELDEGLGRIFTKRESSGKFKQQKATSKKFERQDIRRKVKEKQGMEV